MLRNVRLLLIGRARNSLGTTLLLGAGASVELRNARLSHFLLRQHAHRGPYITAKTRTRARNCALDRFVCTLAMREIESVIPLLRNSVVLTNSTTELRNRVLAGAHFDWPRRDFHFCSSPPAASERQASRKLEATQA